MLLPSWFLCTKKIWYASRRANARRTKQIDKVMKLKHLGSRDIKRHFHPCSDKVRFINLQSIHLFIQTLFLLVFPEGIIHWSVPVKLLFFISLICLCIWTKFNTRPYRETFLNLSGFEKKSKGRGVMKAKFWYHRIMFILSGYDYCIKQMRNPPFVSKF